MNILLTGSSGFLGSHLLERLLVLKHSVSCLKRHKSDLWRVKNLIDKASWYDVETTEFKDLLVENNIDCIIHCATDYGRKEIDPLQTIEANLVLPLKLLQACNGTNVSSFINTDTILDKRISNYSLSKSQFVDWLKFYSEDYVVINFALEHFYGPKDDITKFASFIINELIDNEKKAIDLTEGLQQRDFIYIEDVIDAFEILIKELVNINNSFNHFEVGTNQLVSIKDFVIKVKELCQNKNTKLNFGSLPYRKNETMLTNADTQFLRSLGWSPKFSLEEGLMLTIKQERKFRE